MEAINPIFGILGLTGLIFLVIGAIYFKFPMKRINRFIGYRTSKSMMDQERWDFAQRYSTRLMLKIGALFILIALLSLVVPLSHNWSLVIGSAILICGVICLLICTDRAIVRAFGK
jgi:uncharacterized membrane protein